MSFPEAVGRTTAAVEVVEEEGKEEEAEVVAIEAEEEEEEEMGVLKGLLKALRGNPPCLICFSMSSGGRCSNCIMIEVDELLESRRSRLERDDAASAGVVAVASPSPDLKSTMPLRPSPLPPPPSTSPSPPLPPSITSSTSIRSSISARLLSLKRAPVKEEEKEEEDK